MHGIILIFLRFVFSFEDIVIFDINHISQK